MFLEKTGNRKPREERCRDVEGGGQDLQVVGERQHMARTTQRKRRRRTGDGDRSGGSESDGGGSGGSEDERDECEKEERRWQLRLRRSTTTPDDTKGKGKELAIEDEYDDDDEESTSTSESDDYEGNNEKEEKEVGAVAVAVAEEQQQQQDHKGVGQDLGQEPLRPAKEVGTPRDEICGICLSEGGNESGKLDCCDHFFCFACIMEWSKVESRCPMCKQRFVTVTRPAVSGISRSRPRSFRIPTRDQVYEPSEEEIRLFADPYQNTVCTECQEAGDEGLLLLCDRCDAAAHTYCVGLGRSVPRGDWFCQTCQLLNQETSEDDEDTTFDMTDAEEEEGSGTDSFLAMGDVRPNLFVRRTTRSAAGTQGQVPLRRSTRRRARRNSLSNSAALADALMDISPSSQRRGRLFPSLMETHSARTLSHQRQVQATVQNRLQNMRENWNRYRSGEVQFGSESNSVESSRPGSAGGGSSSTARLGNRYRIGASGIAMDVDQATAPSTSQTGRGSGRSAESGEIERAWANLDRAVRLVGSTSSASQPVGTPRSSSAVDRKREEVKPLGTPVSARTREKSHQADALTSSSRGPLGERHSQADHHSRSNSSRGTRDERHPQGDRHSRSNTAREGMYFLTRSSDNSRDTDSRDHSREGLPARPSENGHVDILSSGAGNSRRGYYLRESNRPHISRTRNNLKDSPAGTIGSWGRSPVRSILDDKDNSRGSGGVFTRSREAKENQAQQVQSIFDDKDNSRGSVGVMTRSREAKDGQDLQGRSILDERDNSNSRDSIGSSRREMDRSRLHYLARGRDQAIARDPSKDREVMKEQCVKLVHIALKPILEKGTIDKYQFKELARSATHTILSSLGVPGLKHGTDVVAVGTITCDHEQPTSSSLVPGCCTSCVQRHVKKYVKSLVKEKIHVRI